MTGWIYTKKQLTAQCTWVKGSRKEKLSCRVSSPTVSIRGECTLDAEVVPRSSNREEATVLMVKAAIHLDMIEGCLKMPSDL
jgi:hypothetical protein